MFTVISLILSHVQDLVEQELYVLVFFPWPCLFLGVHFISIFDVHEGFSHALESQAMHTMSTVTTVFHYPFSLRFS